MSATPDRELIERHLQGDRRALAEIYDRYGGALYDVARSMTGHEADAADLVQDTFVIAATRLDQLRDRDRLKAWLFSVLRHEVYRRTRRRQRERPLEEMDDMAISGGSDTEAPVDDAALEIELAALVRDAEAGLDERDRLALELSVRQGLEGADLASALGVSTAQSYSIVFRMRQRVERSMGAVVVARAGRADCAELSKVLAGWDGTFDRLVRKRVSRHVDGCDACEATRRRLDPLALVRTAPAFAVPIGLRTRVLDAAGGIGPAGSTGSTGSAGSAPGLAGDGSGSAPAADAAGTRGRADGDALGPVDEGGFPVGTSSRGRARGVIAAGVVLVVVLLVGLLAVVLGGSDEVATVPAGAGGPTTVAMPPRSGSASTTAPGDDPGLGLAGGTTAPGAPSGVGDDPGPDDLAPGGDGDPSGDDGGAPDGGVDGGGSGTTGGLTVVPAALDLTTVNPTGVVRVTNTGAEPVTPVATTTGPLSVGPIGSIAAGGQVALPITFTGGSLAEGDHDGTVTITASGVTATVAVRGRVDRAPSVRVSTVEPVLFRAAAAPCGPVTAVVRATVGDESPITSVVLRWTGPGSAGSKPMVVQPDGRTWTSSLGPFPAPGGLSYAITAADAHGNEATVTRDGVVRPC